MRFGIVVLASVVVQVSVSDVVAFGPQRIKPDLLLGLAVELGFWPGNNNEMMLGCILLGLAKDLTSVAPLGSYMICFSMLGYVNRQVREALYGDRLIPMMMMAIAGGFMVEQMALGLSWWKGLKLTGSYGSISLVMVLSALYTSAVVPYIYWLMRKLQRPLGLPRGRSYT